VTMQHKTLPSIACGTNFPDSSLTDEAWEREIALHFLSKRNRNKDDLSNEQKRYQTKWFDYRGIHFGAATAWFMDCFKAEYRRAVLKYYDHTQGNRTGLGARRLFDLKPADITGLWRARQAADDLGIPYPTYCRGAIDAAVLNGNWRLPRPEHLYSDDCKRAAADLWHQERLARVFIATDPFFSAQNYVGHPAQDDYYAWLVDIFRQRPGGHYAAYKAIYERAAIPAEVVERLSPAIFARVKEICPKI
jgi:hypothetical protein